MSLIARAALAAALLGCLARVAAADRVVAVAPLSTLGAEDKSAATKKLLAQIEAAIAALPETKVVAAAQVAEAIERAHQGRLLACDGDAACLTEVGKLVGAQIVVAGEVGGLGDSRVIYLSATDVGKGKELRSTTFAVGATDEGGGASGAAIRLLDPDKYRGVLHFQLDVTGATVYVNGAQVALSGKSELALPVGTQAVRITHPQYHDFIKFIDVAYDRTIDVPVHMQEYPIVEHDVRAANSFERGNVTYVDPPLWRRWYVAGPVIAVVAVGVGLLAYHFAHDGLDATTCRPIGAPTGCQ